MSFHVSRNGVFDTITCPTVAPSDRLVKVTTGGECLIGTDYFVDNTAGNVNVNFASPTADKIGEYTTLVIQGDPDSHMVQIFSQYQMDIINGHDNGVGAGGEPFARFSTALVGMWFEVKVYVKAAGWLAITSPQPYALYYND